MNNYFINITENLDLKPLTVSNTSDMDEIAKHFDDHNHISVCKIKEAYSEILKEDNFKFQNGFHGRSQESNFEIKLEKNIPRMVPSLQVSNYKDSFEISDKHYQSFFKSIHFY